MPDDIEQSTTATRKAVDIAATLLVKAAKSLHTVQPHLKKLTPEIQHKINALMGLVVTVGEAATDMAKDQSRWGNYPTSNLPICPECNGTGRDRTNTALPCKDCSV